MSNLDENEDGLEAFKSQSPEDQKDQCRKSTYYDLLKQSIKKNKNARIYLNANSSDNLTKGQNFTQKIYRVQRRRDIIKDDYSLFVDHGRGVADRNIIKNLRKGVQYLRKLRIRLDQLWQPVMTKNWIRLLHGKHLPSLKTLELNPSSATILERREGRFPLFRSRPSNVENLKIVFHQIHVIKNAQIEDFTLRLIRRIRKLKHLCFDVYSCTFMKDEHLDVIGKALRSRLHHLESLEMSFGAISYETTAKGVAKLWKSLDKIPNLKKLELGGSFSSGVVDHEAFVVLCDVIRRKSTTLTTLKLNLRSIGLGYDAHQYLCDSLINLLPRLQELELKFGVEDSTSDESLPLLGDLLGNSSSSLKILALDFHSCYKITPKGAQEFAERLKKGSFPAVEKLWIYFHRMPKQRFEGFYAIAEAVSRVFPNIKDLTFGFQLDPRRHSKDNYELNDYEIQTKAEMMLKERLKKLSKDFGLNWIE